MGFENHIVKYVTTYKIEVHGSQSGLLKTLRTDVTSLLTPLEGCAQSYVDMYRKEGKDKSFKLKWYSATAFSDFNNKPFKEEDR